MRHPMLFAAAFLCSLSTMFFLFTASGYTRPLTPDVASLEVKKTVGTEGPTVCAPTSTLTIPTGTQVFYCFTIKNTGDEDIGAVSFADAKLGINVPPITLPDPIAPASSFTVTADVAQPLGINLGPYVITETTISTLTYVVTTTIGNVLTGNATTTVFVAPSGTQLFLPIAHR